ncbi:hypothetical protein ACQKGI_09730 [Peribacillus muralis]|uniref:hypothetical protein n=1 Tax=Peribacillus muralis TaxID=264697 RepID=UPI0038244CC3
MILSDFGMHHLSEDTVLTKFRIFDEVMAEHTIRSSIRQNHNGSWQMFFHQGPKTNCPLINSKVCMNVSRNYPTKTKEDDEADFSYY